MSKLRELIESQPRLINIMVARAFINELEEVDLESWNVITSYCDSAIQSVNLLKISLGTVLHYEERAKCALNAVDSEIVAEVKDYIADAMARFEEEEYDDEDPKTAANSLMGWDPR